MALSQWPSHSRSNKSSRNKSHQGHSPPARPPTQMPRDARTADRFQPDADPQQFLDQWIEVDLPDKYHCHLNEIIIHLNIVYFYDAA